MDTILPCPFCGNEPVLHDRISGAKFAHCETPGCLMGKLLPYLEDWNKRPQPSAPVQPVAWVFPLVHGSRVTLSRTEFEAARANAYEADEEFDESKYFPLYASPSAPREPTEAEREALWAAMRASSEIVHPGRLAPSAQPQPEEARELNLKWGRHDGRGKYHIEWHAPCGCAYHPQPKPHVHPCIRHSEIDPCQEK